MFSFFEEGSEISCGVGTIVGVNENTPKQVLQDMVETYELYGRPEKRDDWGYYEDHQQPVCAFYVFSDIYRDESTGGQALADYIRKHKLGVLAESTIRRNDNSGNRIRAWIWGPNVPAIRAWARAEKEQQENKKKHERKSIAGNSRKRIV